MEQTCEDPYSRDNIENIMPNFGNREPVESEAKKLSTREEELLRKARELENEMRQVRLEKVEVVIRQFEQQLLREAELEERRHTEHLRDQYEARAG